MKNLLLTFMLFNCFLIGAQEEKLSPKDFNFESVTNPAFMLLGETPTDVNTPDNLKSLSLYLSNGFSNTNIALEINPYWVLDFEEQRSYKSYRGIKKNKKGKDHIDPFIGLKTNSSISLGYISKSFEGIEGDKKTLAVGYRGTILQFYNSDRLEKIKSAIIMIQDGVKKPINIKFQEYMTGSEDAPDIGTHSCDIINTDQALKDKYLKIAEEFLERVFDDPDPEDPDNFAIESRQILESLGRKDISKDEVVDEYFEEYCSIIKNFVNNRKTIKPVFRLDGAIGYSLLFKENEIKSSTAHRFGSWLTADVAVKFNDNSYLNIYAIGKYIDDGFNVDNGIYYSRSYWDIGGKIEFDLNKFKLSYEYLNRSGFGDQHRSVGNITYQLSSKMSITGGFGKDFPVDDNLVSIIGVNWGLDLGENDFTN